MATVSILIPARKADYLGRALASAQRQTYEDIEILVGDDTPDAALASLVRELGDTRIRYFHHGFGDGRRNAEALWRAARGRYVKWLSQSDMLMPRSVEMLVDALRLHPESALAFHGRVVIDENDAVVHEPSTIVDAGERALVDRELLVAEMVAQQHNFVGELSNVLMDRERAEARLSTYRSLKLDFLGDVATFLNLAEYAPLVAVGGHGSMLRRPAAQISPATHPNYSAGLYEWELLLRGEAAAGRLAPQALAEAAGRLKQHYARFAGELPEIGRLLANLDELTTGEPRALFDSPRYQSDLAQARAAVAARMAGNGRRVGAASASAPAPAAQKICAVCEQQVDAWRPATDAADRSFLEFIDPVGSSLGAHACPSCGSTDRERHLWLYVAFSGLLERAGEMRILHIAPEAAIEARIRRLEPLEYVAGDRSPRATGHLALNLEALDLPSGHFDLVICNHVLDRVESAHAVLTQLQRVLKPGGHLIAQTPYSPVLKRTFELTKRPSPQFAARYFGEAAHQRFFGADVADSFHAAGFKGELKAHREMLGEAEGETWGVDVREPFFLFQKDASRVQNDPASPGSCAVRAAAPGGHAGAATRTTPDTAACAAATDATRRAAPSPELPIRLVCATRCAQENFLRDTALGRSLAVYRHANPPELLLFDKNSTGLPKLYNAAIEQAASSPAILVFVHDDVSIVDYFWMDRLRDALARFDVVGLAGNRRRSPLQPAWAFATPDFKWDTPEYLSGSVGHGKGFPCDEVSYFGPSGVECKLLDGLMLVADSTRLVEAGVRFDEQFDFHFYDMDFCRQAESKGLRMGTWPISVVHESAGAFNTPPWRAGYERYLRKYGE